MTGDEPPGGSSRAGKHQLARIPRRCGPLLTSQPDVVIQKCASSVWNVHVPRYVCIHTHTHTHTHTHMLYIYIYIYIYNIHTHTHTHMYIRSTIVSKMIAGEAPGRRRPARRRRAGRPVGRRTRRARTRARVSLRGAFPLCRIARVRYRGRRVEGAAAPPRPEGALRPSLEGARWKQHHSSVARVSELSWTMGITHALIARHDSWMSRLASSLATARAEYSGTTRPACCTCPPRKSSCHRRPRSISRPARSGR